MIESVYAGWQFGHDQCNNANSLARDQCGGVKNQSFVEASRVGDGTAASARASANTGSVIPWLAKTNFRARWEAIHNERNTVPGSWTLQYDDLVMPWYAGETVVK